MTTFFFFSMAIWVMQRFGGVQSINSRHLREEGFAVVDYFDLRDCGRACKGLTIAMSWSNPTLCQPGTRLDVHYFVSGVPSLTSPFDNEGRIMVHNLPRDVVVSEFQSLLQFFGDVRKITLSTKTQDSSSWVVEYFDLRSASDACTKLNRHVIENRALRVIFLNGYTSWAIAGFAPPPPPPQQMPSRRQSVDLSHSTFYEMQARRHSLDMGGTFHDPQMRRHSIAVAGSGGVGFQDSRRFSFPTPISSCAHSRSPSPNTSSSIHTSPQFMASASHNAITPPSPNTGATAARPAASSTFPPSPPSSPPSLVFSPPHHHSHGAHHAHAPSSSSSSSTIMSPPNAAASTPNAHHNGMDSKHHPNRIPESFQIDLDNIKNGVDKRTTLMIRNIPNKYTQDMFLDFVNETHKGKYDFIYLPIDFKNKCNVGYSFVNFIDPKSISTLFTRIQGKKWTRFNSEKICAVSYARIQGKENLIRHFQNST